MSDAAQQAAEDGVRSVAASMGLKELPVAQVQAIAGAFLGLMNLATNTTWGSINEAAKAAAEEIRTDADAASELDR